MPTQVDAALVEISAAQAALEPELEGLLDFERLNIIPDAHAEIQEAIRFYQRRKELLDTAHRSLDALNEQDYPGLPVRQVASDVYADLLDQQRTIAAALAKFTADQAAALQMSASEPRPKT